MLQEEIKNGEVYRIYFDENLSEKDKKFISGFFLALGGETGKWPTFQEGEGLMFQKIFFSPRAFKIKLLGDSNAVQEVFLEKKEGEVGFNIISFSDKNDYEIEIEEREEIKIEIVASRHQLEITKNPHLRLKGDIQEIINLFSELTDNIKLITLAGKIIEHSVFQDPFLKTFLPETIFASFKAVQIPLAINKMARFLKPDVGIWCEWPGRTLGEKNILVFSKSNNILNVALEKIGGQIKNNWLLSKNGI